MAIPVFDMHSDTADRLAWQSLDQSLKDAVGKGFYGPGDSDDPASCRELVSNNCMISLENCAAQPWAQCLACFIPDQLSPEQALAFYNHVFAYAGEQLAANAGRAVDARSAAQIAEVLEGAGADASASDAPRFAGSADAAGAPRFAGVHTIENARLFAADMSQVETLANKGVLMASISWNAAGPLASGHDSHQGLTELGRQALAEMERCGMIFDVSHLNDECFAEVAERSKRPFVASHSNSRAVCSHRRNLTDDQFRTIRDRGGVVGLNFCSYFIVDGASGDKAAGVTFEQTAAHIEHWLELDGEDVIALGADWDGADVPDFVADGSHMPSFQEQLIARFGEAITRKLCYANALRFFTENAQ